MKPTLSPDVIFKLNNIEKEISNLVHSISSGKEVEYVGWVCRNVDSDVFSSNCSKSIKIKPTDKNKAINKIQNLNNEMLNILKE